MAQVVCFDTQRLGSHTLGAESLDHPHTSDGLLDHGCKLRRLTLHTHDCGVKLLSEAPTEHVDQRQRCQCQHGQRRLRQEHDDHRTGNQNELAGGERDHRDHVLEVLQVGIGSTHQIAGCIGVVEREVQPLDMREDPVTQSRLDHPAITKRHEAPQPQAHRRQDTGGNDQHRPHQEGTIFFNASVDALLHQQRNRNPTDRPAEGHNLAIDNEAAFFLDR